MKFSFDRVSNKTIVKEAAANTPSSLLGNLKSVTTNGKYAVTFRLKSPQVDVAVHSRDAGRVHRALGHVRAEPPAWEHRGADRNGPVRAHEVLAGSAGCLHAQRQLLEHAGEDGQPHHPVLREVVDDEARDPARRDRHVVPVVHAEGDHVAPEAEGSSGLLGRGRPHPLPRDERDAPAGEQRRRPACGRVPHAASVDRRPRLPRPGEAAVFAGAGRLSRSHRRVRIAVRSEPEPGEGEGASCRQPGSPRRFRSRSGGRRRTTETPRPTSTQRSSAVSRRTASSR